MAARLLEYFKHEISLLQLVPSSGGRYEVTVDDRLIFSKIATGRFPEFSELRDQLEPHRAPHAKATGSERKGRRQATGKRP